MGFGVAICIVIIDIFKCRCPLHGSVCPWKREDVTHLKQRQLWVDFLSMTVVWEVWRMDNPLGGGGTIHLQGLHCQGSKQPPGREQRSTGHTSTAFRDDVSNCWSWEKLWAKLSADVAHLSSSRVIAGEMSAVARACPALRVQTAWEWLKNALGFYKRGLNSHLCVLSILNL